MPRKKKVKASTEPTTVAEVLEQSPVASMIADQAPAAADQSPVAVDHEPKAPTLDSFLTSREAKAQLDPERGMPEPEPGEEAVQAFKRQREREMAATDSPTHTEAVGHSTGEAAQEPEQRSHVQRLSEPRGLRPTPKGFRGEEGHYHAGVRLSRSLDKNVVAIQFSDDRKPTRDGEGSEKEQLESRGFLYVPMRSQWERVDREQPGENYQDAKVLVESLVRDRLAKPAAEVQR